MMRASSLLPIATRLWMTIQVRLPRGAQAASSTPRILAHLVDELQPKGGSTMRRYAILFALVSLLLPATVFSQTRTPEAAVNHYKTALKKSGNGDFDGAIEDYNQALEIRPGLASAYLNRAAALRAQGDLEAAVKDLDRAIALKKDFFEAFSNRGSMRLDLKDTSGALSDLNRALELNDRIAEPYYQRGYVYMALQDFNRAVADF